MTPINLLLAASSDRAFQSLPVWCLQAARETLHFVAKQLIKVENLLEWKLLNFHWWFPSPVKADTRSRFFQRKKKVIFCFLFFLKANQIFFEMSFLKLDFVQLEDLRYRFPSSTHPSQVGAGACLGHLMKKANRCFSIPVFQNKACWNLESVS